MKPTREGNFIRYVHRPDHGLTIGYVAEQLPDRIKVKSAYSIVSNRDTFNRSIGRDVVAGRLLCDRANKNYPHHHEFFLSGTLPTTGDKWREFEHAIIAQTGEFYDRKQEMRKLDPHVQVVQEMMERQSQVPTLCDDGN